MNKYMQEDTEDWLDPKSAFKGLVGAQNHRTQHHTWSKTQVVGCVRSLLVPFRSKNTLDCINPAGVFSESTQWTT